MHWSGRKWGIAWFSRVEGEHGKMMESREVKGLETQMGVYRGGEQIAHGSDHGYERKTVGAGRLRKRDKVSLGVSPPSYKLRHYR